MSDEPTTEPVQANTEPAVGGEPTATSWTDGFGDLKGNDHLKAYEGEENVGALAKDYVALKDAAPKVPESADKYEMSVPDGVELDKTMVSDFKTMAHKANYSNEQVQGAIDFHIAFMDRVQKNYDAAQAKFVEDAETKLKADWSDKYDENLATANKAIAKFGGDELSGVLKELGLDSHPLVVQAFYKIGNAISEGTFKDGVNVPEGRQIGIDGKGMLAFPSMEKES